VRFRRRLAAYFGEYVIETHSFYCRQLFERETGGKVPRYGSGWSFPELFKSSELRDVLDAITITFRTLHTYKGVESATRWREFVSRAMREENVGYSLDDKCVVHFYVDQEFERNRAAAVAALDAPQFGGVRAAFDDAYRHLDADPRDTKAAARSIFEALEIMAKLIVPDAPRLTRNLCVQKLREACISAAGVDTTEQRVLGDLFTSLGYWVDGVHDYRHGQPGHESVAPSEQTAVLILSTGTAYLRELASLQLRRSAEAL